MVGKLTLGLIALVVLGVIAYMMMRKEGLKDIYFTTPQYVGALEFTPNLESFKPTGVGFTPDSKLLPTEENMQDFNMVASQNPERMQDFNMVASQNPERMQDFNMVASQNPERMSGWLFSDYPDNAFYDKFIGNPRTGKAIGSGIRVYPRGHKYMPGFAVNEGFVDLNPDEKIDICSYSSGKPKDMSIPKAAWESHKSQGATLGKCGTTPIPRTAPEGGKLLPFNIDFDNEMALSMKGEGFSNAPSEKFCMPQIMYNDREIDGCPQLTPILNGAYQTIIVMSATTKDGRLVYEYYGTSKKQARDKWMRAFPGCPIPKVVQGDDPEIPQQ